MKRMSAMLAALAILMTGAMSIAKEGGPPKKGDAPQILKAAGTVTEFKNESITIQPPPKVAPQPLTLAIDGNTKVKVQSGTEAVTDKEGKPVVDKAGNPKQQPAFKDGTTADITVGASVTVTYTADAKALEIRVLTPEAPKKPSKDGGAKDGK